MKQYSFLNTIVLVNGIRIQGWDEGDDTIDIQRRKDSAQDKVGSGGEMSVAISADRTGEFTFKLMQTSASNKYLSALITAQEQGILVPVFVQFKDTQGNELASGTQGYIPKPASMTRGENVNSGEWKVVVERLDLLYGN